ncbi:MAG: hypothetical protein E7J99_03660 [Clostridium butyricum]|uniref:hypothetical protein n=1 Tax=unclassified Clostridium TaxID=2614128 RepID=UPI00224DC4EA|nr:MULTISPECIES: hypothetical protein [unclassified Clostridium]MDU7711226.1 hypothetical protein [Clostridium butyricum]MDU1115290.1 hypothetical protein [Clostridium sp.]MDU1232600.1 hypothetical protein [Clostridium sp.]MDU3091721.1 hypothetical protein [Clostridium sp.]UZT07875.1 hypothetical protein ONV75_08405 [Clostridium sp. LQ25]
MNTIENQLKELILTKYKSLREFTLKIEMPYSTFDTILKRGVNKANIINIIRICNELNISADKLAEGIIENNSLTTNNNLSKEETTLLENYNNSNYEGKKMILSYSDYVSQNYKNTTDEITATTDNVVELNNKKITYDDFETVAAHNDNLTDDEISEADRRILADINKRNSK